jgi:hypothetical protein
MLRDKGCGFDWDCLQTPTPNSTPFKLLNFYTSHLKKDIGILAEQWLGWIGILTLIDEVCPSSPLLHFSPSPLQMTFVISKMVFFSDY